MIALGDKMLERLLRSSHTVRWLFLILVGSAAVAVMFKFLALPLLSKPTEALGPFQDPGANITSYAVDALVQTLLTTFLLAVFFVLLVPPELRAAQVETLDPRDIREALTEHLKKTDHYWFRGRSARWFRATVLPVLQAEARADGRTKAIRVLLPDPANIQLMVDYADYRNSIAFRGQSKSWTPDDIQCEVAATIVGVTHAHATSVLIDARIGLLDHYSLLRSDITSYSAVLTREDPKSPAIKCRAGTALYDAYREEVVQGITQGKKVPVDDPSLKNRPLDAAFVKDVLNLTGLNAIAQDSQKVNVILNSALKPNDPYK